MGITLVINPGSSSKKYSVFQDERPVASFRFEKTGDGYEICRDINGIAPHCEGVPAETFGTALRQVIDALLLHKIIQHIPDINRVGIRIVAPGTRFAQHERIDEAYVMRLREIEASAPLHLPSTIREIEQAMQELPEAIIVGASDSAFHHTIPIPARMPAIDWTDIKTYDLQQFGYHGLSATAVLDSLTSGNKSLPSRLIVAHIGSGVSLTAIKDGKSIDTTMGYGPASGVMMGMRTGDIDPSLLIELMRVKNMNIDEVTKYVQQQGGFFGWTGIADFRLLLDRYAHREEMVVLAFLKCQYQIRKTIGAFTAALGGLDAMVLTATAMERSPALRLILFGQLQDMGIVIDEAINDTLINHDGVISQSGSHVTVMVQRTNEARTIAKIVSDVTK